MRKKISESKLFCRRAILTSTKNILKNKLIAVKKMKKTIAHINQFKTSLKHDFKKGLQAS